MTVWMLTHYNGLDYYQKDRTVLGIYSTKEKAIEACRKEQATDHKDYKAKLWEEMTEDEQRFSDLYYEIEECQVDPEKVWR